MANKLKTRMRCKAQRDGRPGYVVKTLVKNFTVKNCWLLAPMQLFSTYLKNFQEKSTFTPDTRPSEKVDFGWVKTPSSSN